MILLLFLGQEASTQDQREAPGRAASSYREDEKTIPRPSSGVGVLEIPRPDGTRDKIYYSTITPEEEAQRIREEKEKSDRAWEMLQNVIIDKRKK